MPQLLTASNGRKLLTGSAVDSYNQIIQVHEILDLDKKLAHEGPREQRVHRGPNQDRRLVEIKMDTQRDDEAARKARADRLHERIEQAKSGSEWSEPAATPGSVGNESPREFIERRMREWPEGSEDEESVGSPEPPDVIPCEPSDDVP